MRNKNKLLCPRCYSSKVHGAYDQDNQAWCEKCDYSGYIEDSIYGKGFLHPAVVPYKYWYQGDWKDWVQFYEGYILPKYKGKDSWIETGLNQN